MRKHHVGHESVQCSIDFLVSQKLHGMLFLSMYTFIAFIRLAKSTHFMGRLPVFYYFYPSTRFLTLPVLGIQISRQICCIFTRAGSNYTKSLQLQLQLLRNINFNYTTIMLYSITPCSFQLQLQFHFYVNDTFL